MDKYSLAVDDIVNCRNIAAEQIKSACACSFDKAPCIIFTDTKRFPITSYALMKEALLRQHRGAINCLKSWLPSNVLDCLEANLEERLSDSEYERKTDKIMPAWADTTNIWIRETYAQATSVKGEESIGWTKHPLYQEKKGAGESFLFANTILLEDMSDTAPAVLQRKLNHEFAHLARHKLYPLLSEVDYLLGEHRAWNQGFKGVTPSLESRELPKVIHEYTRARTLFYFFDEMYAELLSLKSKEPLEEDTSGWLYRFLQTSGRQIVSKNPDLFFWDTNRPRAVFGYLFERLNEHYMKSQREFVKEEQDKVKGRALKSHLWRTHPEQFGDAIQKTFMQAFPHWFDFWVWEKKAVLRLRAQENSCLGCLYAPFYLIGHVTSKITYEIKKRA